MGIFGGGSPDKVLAQAEALLKKGRAPDAGKLLKEKVEDATGLPEEQKLHCAELYLATGLIADAEDLLLSMVTRPGKDKDVARARALLMKHLTGLRDPVNALDVLWTAEIRTGAFDEGRKFIRRALDQAPAILPGLRTVAEARAGGGSLAVQGHILLAHIALAEGHAREALFHLRTALYGPPDLSAHAAGLLAKVQKALPENLGVRWALLETGHTKGADWIEETLDLATHEPVRLVEYLRQAMAGSTPPATESLRQVALGVIDRFPGLVEGHELVADLDRGDPIPEIRARAEILRLVPGTEHGQRALARIREIEGEAGEDLAVRMEVARALLHLPDLKPARQAIAGLVQTDPMDALNLVGEARAGGGDLPHDFLIFEATCYHALGNDAAAVTRLREATDIPAPERLAVIRRLRARSPSSPDLCFVLAEVLISTGDLSGAAEALRTLIAHAPRSAESILTWLDTPAAADLTAGVDAEALRARAFLATGREADAVPRIVRLEAEGHEWARSLVSAAARVRASGASDPALTAEVLRLLGVTGQHSDLALILARRLHEEGEDRRAIEAIGGDLPVSPDTEEAWLATGAGLYVAVGRVADAVRVADSASDPELALSTLEGIVDAVPPEERNLVLEGQVEVLLQSSGDAGRITDLLTRILDEHDERTEAVAALLGRMANDDSTRARRLLLSARAEDRLDHRNHAGDLYRSAAALFSDQGRAEMVRECADRLSTMVQAEPDHDHVRICLSRVETLSGEAEAALAPIRDVEAPNPRLLSRIDEIEREFPGYRDAPWTAVQWLMEMGSYREVVKRLRLLSKAPDADRARIRAEAERAYEAGRLPSALNLIADLDSAEGDVAGEIATSVRIFDDHPDAYASVRERLLTLSHRQPRLVEPLTTALDHSRQAEDLAGLVETATAALSAPLDTAGIEAVATAVAAAGDFEEAENSDAYWSVLIDHAMRARDGDGVVEGCRKLLLVSGDPERTVERRLLTLSEDGLLPLAGIELLITRYREFAEPDELAKAARMRLVVEEEERPGKPDKKTVVGLREMGEDLLAAGADSAKLRRVLVDLCLYRADPVGAATHVAEGLDLIGTEGALSLLARIEEAHPKEARVPLLRATRVLAPAGRVGEAALDIEKVETLDEDLAVEEGLAPARDLLAEHAADPDLRRILARLLIREGTEEDALENLNRLAASGSEFREQALEIFPWFTKRFSNSIEGRIRHAEVLAESARSPEMENRRAERFAKCEEVCREALGRSPEAAEEIRTVKLLATALEARNLFEEAYADLARVSAEHVEEVELLRRIRQNHVRRMLHVGGRSEEGKVRAAALLLAGKPGKALGALDPVDPEDPENQAVRLLAHFAAGNHEQVVTEGRAVVSKIEREGDLGPEEMEILYHFGRSQLLLGREAAGLSHLERLALVAPGHRGCRAFLEDYYRRKEPGTLRLPELTATLEEVRNEERDHG